MEYYEHKLDPVGVRPEWLADDEEVPVKYDLGGWALHNLYTAAERNWENKTAIRLPADHWAVPALKEGRVPVRGPEGLTPEVVRKRLEDAWDMEERWEGDFIRPSIAARERMVKAILAEQIDPIKAALQDKWPALDTDALRETLAKHNLKIVEA